ncbi:efflux RND transporter periplasmic adaptor subunit [Martelella soudanensis]|uniref:efflux RND transporter periplasmic adaptor subunit n=1 Tax=unclassified Martelella TaxID=2629616 RepID=UPI0015DE2B90|nr:MULTISPECIES: efflux RND transporter periplasmic adaptor subunit [unclassified Martelella]
MKSRTIATIVFVLVVLGGAGYWLWNRYEAPKGQLPATTAVTRGDIEETVLATGIVKPVRLVAVGAQASGRITHVAVKLGETVRQGDLIAEIDSGTQENALRTAQAALDNARAQLQEKQATLKLNQQKLERYTELFNKNTGTRADYESALAEVDVTTAQIAAIRAAIVEAEVAVDTAKVNLGYTRITAPSDGTVLAIVSQEGQTVNATQSAPTIVVLGQLDRMTVRTEISEADITKVSPGMPVTFTVFGDPDTVYRSTLESIEPAPESVKTDSSFSTSSSTSSSSSEAVYYNGVFTVPNDDGTLKTYMTAEVEIVLGTASNVLTIPSSVLGTPDGDGRYTVQVLDDAGKITPARIEIGLDNRVRVEVKSGLSEGDRIATGGGDASGDREDTPRPPMGF